MLSKFILWKIASVYLLKEKKKTFTCRWSYLNSCEVTRTIEHVQITILSKTSTPTASVTYPPTILLLLPVVVIIIIIIALWKIPGDIARELKVQVEELCVSRNFSTFNSEICVVSVVLVVVVGQTLKSRGSLCAREEHVQVEF